MQEISNLFTTYLRDVTTFRNVKTLVCAAFSEVTVPDLSQVRQQQNHEQPSNSLHQICSCRSTQPPRTENTDSRLISRSNRQVQTFLIMTCREYRPNSRRRRIPVYKSAIGAVGSANCASIAGTFAKRNAADHENAGSERTIPATRKAQQCRMV